MIPSPESYLPYSPGSDSQQAMSPPDCCFSGLRPAVDGADEWFDLQSRQNLNSSAFFWKQLQKEEVQLRDVSDGELLATDGQRRT